MASRTLLPAIGRSVVPCRREVRRSPGRDRVERAGRIGQCASIPRGAIACRDLPAGSVRAAGIGGLTLTRAVTAFLCGSIRISVHLSSSSPARPRRWRARRCPPGRDLPWPRYAGTDDPGPCRARGGLRRQRADHDDPARDPPLAILPHVPHVDSAKRSCETTRSKTSGRPAHRGFPETGSCRRRTPGSPSATATESRELEGKPPYCLPRRCAKDWQMVRRELIVDDHGLRAVARSSGGGGLRVGRGRRRRRALAAVAAQPPTPCCSTWTADRDGFSVATISTADGGPLSCSSARGDAEAWMRRITACGARASLRRRASAAASPPLSPDAPTLARPWRTASALRIRCCWTRSREFAASAWAGSESTPRARAAAWLRIRVVVGLVAASLVALERSALAATTRPARPSPRSRCSPQIFSGRARNALWTLGYLLDTAWVAVLVQVVLTFPEGRAWSPAARTCHLQAPMLATLGGQLIGVLVLAELARRAGCRAPADGRRRRRSRCRERWASPSRSACCGCSCAGLPVLRGPARRAQAPLLAAAAVAAASARSLARLDDRDGCGPSATIDTIDRGFALLVPLGIVAGLSWSRLRRSEASDLVVELRTDGATSLRERLATVLGDPTVDVVYRLGRRPSRGRCGSAAGASARPGAGDHARDRAR